MDTPKQDYSPLRDTGPRGPRVKNVMLSKPTNTVQTPDKSMMLSTTLNPKMLKQFFHHNHPNTNVTSYDTMLKSPEWGRSNNNL